MINANNNGEYDKPIDWSKIKIGDLPDAPLREVPPDPGRSYKPESDWQIIISYINNRMPDLPPLDNNENDQEDDVSNLPN